MDEEDTPLSPPNAPQQRTPTKQLPKAAPSRRRMAQRAPPPPTKVRVFTREARGWWVEGGRPDKRLKGGRMVPTGAAAVVVSHVRPWISLGLAPHHHPHPQHGGRRLKNEDSRPRSHRAADGRGQPDLVPPAAGPAPGPRPPVPRRPHGQGHHHHARATARRRAGGATPTEAAAPDPVAPCGRAERQKPRRRLPRRRPGLARRQPQAVAREEGDG